MLASAALFVLPPSEPARTPLLSVHFSKPPSSPPPLSTSSPLCLVDGDDESRMANLYPSYSPTTHISATTFESADTQQATCLWFGKTGAHTRFLCLRVYNLFLILGVRLKNIHLLRIPIFYIVSQLIF